ncbi:HDIG domain-containing protein [bacterium]|nr:HDIG domain-containing protein [bacterium]
MKKFNLTEKINDIRYYRNTINIIIILIFAALFTGILVSKYFFQTIVDNNNTSKVTVIAQKNIEVVDTLKTEARKREVAEKVDVVYTPGDTVYIQNNLNEFIEEIKQIRANDKTLKEKQKELEIILDVANNPSKEFISGYLLNANDELLNKVFTSAQKTLSLVLSEGITEKDFEETALNKIIRRNIEANSTNSQIKVITALLKQVIVPNMVIDEEATNLARKHAKELVSPIKVKFNKGDTIVKVGEPVTQIKREALSKAGYNILRINFKGLLGVFCLVCIGTFSVFYYMQKFEVKLLEEKRMYIVGLLSLAVALCALIMPATVSVFWLPFPFFAIILSVFFNPRSSFFITTVLLTVISLALQFSALSMFVFVVAIAVATIEMTNIQYSRRLDLIRVGLYVSIAMSVVIFCVYYDLGFSRLFEDISAGAGNGFVSGILALGTIPIIENLSKVITMFGLAELGDYNQPLLRKLHEVAPGTFEHSLRVSNLAESAAEAIGANPVLARVGALYHDVGKIKRPLFFVENQTYSGIENPHEKRTPRESKMYITSHTKDGIAYAKEYHIPEIIQDFMIQHHGDSLVSYFYNKAVKEEGVENVAEDQFRYTGPKPNSKETAIIMISDAVESASRTLKDQSQEEIDELINRIIKDRLDDNQLSESPLTLKDIKVIGATLSRVLRSVYHKRIKYQEQVEEELQDKENKAG